MNMAEARAACQNGLSCLDRVREATTLAQAQSDANLAEDNFQDVLNYLREQERLAMTPGGFRHE